MVITLNIRTRLVEPYYHSTIFWADPSPQFPVFYLNFQLKAENSNRTREKVVEDLQKNCLE